VSDPLVSVIIPAYGQGAFLGDAIRSVLAQTYPRFEAIVIDDASPDDSAAVARSFDDPRLILLQHTANRGLSAARNTGIRAAKGDLIALLDSDDMFLPEKLQRHVDYYRDHPETAATYNGRYELNYSDTTIRNLYRPPAVVTLADFVLGFPFAPSDLVVRREWLDRVGPFDERLVYFGEDQDMYCRLALAGGAFGRVDRALNLRRHHSGRYDRRFAERLVHDREILAAVLSDPRCPPEVRALQDEALANHLMVRAFHAFAQDKRLPGQAYLREAVSRHPALLGGEPSRLGRWFLHDAAADENLDHGELLRHIRQQVPEELAWSAGEQRRFEAEGYLLRATRACLWDRPDDAARLFREAAARGARAGEDFLNWAGHQLRDIEHELGPAVADRKRTDLQTLLQSSGNAPAARQLNSICLLNRAFDRYHQGKTEGVTRVVVEAVRHDPRRLANRGVLAIVARSGARWASGRRYRNGDRE
jgi:glycosyltransferase involved in cell wall biosynthesis